MNATVCVARDRFVSFRFFATRCNGAPAIPTPHICGHICRNCTDDRTVGPLRHGAAAWLLGHYNPLYVPMKQLIIDELAWWLPTNQSDFFI
jgi:hypothetical protein